MISRNTWDNVVTVIRDGETDQTWDGKVKNLVYDVDSMGWIAEVAGGVGGGTGGATETTLSELNAKLTASTGTVTSVAGSASSVTLLALNAARKGFMLYNDSSAVCYVAFSGSATSSAFTVKMDPNSLYEKDLANYTGVISGIWASATGAMRVTELT